MEFPANKVADVYVKVLERDLLDGGAEPAQSDDDAYVAVVRREKYRRKVKTIIIMLYVHYTICAVQAYWFVGYIKYNVG